MTRDAQITVAMGKNGTGKSTLIAQLLKKYKAKKVLIVTYNGIPKIWRTVDYINVSDKEAMKDFSGVRQDFAFQHGKDIWKHIYENFHDGVIVFDDMKGYVNSSLNVDDEKLKFLKRLLLDFRHKMIDMYFVVHSPTDVPPKLWMHVSNVLIGATPQYFDKNQVRISGAEQIIELQKQVNAEYLKAFNKKNNSHYGIFKFLKIG